MTLNVKVLTTLSYYKCRSISLHDYVNFQFIMTSTDEFISG